MGRRKLTSDEENMNTVMLAYRKLLREDRIKIGGAAYKRLRELQIRWG